ncbi:serine-rich adhesin for platelets-like isoform X2 [Sycon ciliatum]
MVTVPAVGATPRSMSTAPSVVVSMLSPRSRNLQGTPVASPPSPSHHPAHRQSAFEEGQGASSHSDSIPGTPLSKLSLRTDSLTCTTSMPNSRSPLPADNIHPEAAPFSRQRAAEVTSTGYDHDRTRSLPSKETSPPTFTSDQIRPEIDSVNENTSVSNTLALYKEQQQTLLEYHRRQLADVAAQQQTIEQQQRLCEQLTDLIADQESVLHEHALQSLRSQIPSVHDGSSLSTIPAWNQGVFLDSDVGMDEDENATPLHSTSLYIPVPSDVEDPNIMGDLVPQILDDGLDTLLNDPPVAPLSEFLAKESLGTKSALLPSIIKSSPAVSHPTELVYTHEEAVTHHPPDAMRVKTHSSPVPATLLPPPHADPSHHSTTTSSESQSQADVSVDNATTGLPSDKPAISSAISSKMGEESGPFSMADLQTIKDAATSAQDIRETQLVRLVSSLGSELSQCKQQLQNSLHVQRIQAGALQTLWHEIQDLQKHQRASQAQRTPIPEEHEVPANEPNPDNVSTLKTLCEQLQTQVEFLEDRVSALSGSVYVAGETRRRLQRLGFGLEHDDDDDDVDDDVDGGADEDITAMNNNPGVETRVTASYTDSSSSSSSTSLESMSADSLSPSDEENMEGAVLASEKSPRRCSSPLRPDSCSEERGSPEATSQHSVSESDGDDDVALLSNEHVLCTEPRHHDIIDSDGAEWSISVRRWSTHEVLLAWQCCGVNTGFQSPNVQQLQHTDEGSFLDMVPSEADDSTGDGGLLGYRLLINNVPVIPMIPSPASQVLISGLADGEYELSLLKVHINGETLLGRPVSVSTSDSRESSGSDAIVKSVSSREALASPRCSSTALLPSTPRLRIHYKSLGKVAGQAVLATLKHGDTADSADSSQLDSKHSSPISHASDWSSPSLPSPSTSLSTHPTTTTATTSTITTSSRSPNIPEAQGQLPLRKKTGGRSTEEGIVTNAGELHDFDADGAHNDQLPDAGISVEPINHATRASALLTQLKREMSEIRPLNNEVSVDVAALSEPTETTSISISGHESDVSIPENASPSSRPSPLQSSVIKSNHTPKVTAIIPTTPKSAESHGGVEHSETDTHGYTPDSRRAASAVPSPRSNSAGKRPTPVPLACSFKLQ